MAYLKFVDTPDAAVPTPGADRYSLYASEELDALAYKDPAGVVHPLGVVGATFGIVGEMIATSGAGSVCIVTMPCDGTIVQSDIDGDVSGNAVVDVQKALLATPTVFVSIVAAAPPTLTAAQSASDATLTGWTVGFAEGDRIKFLCTTLVTMAIVSVTLKATRA